MPLTNNPLNSKVAALRSRLLTLPVKVGDTAVLFTKQRFAQKNWINNRTETWRPRKANTKWGKTKRNNGMALLVDSGRLRRSIRIMRKSSTSVTIGSDVPYAAAHNNGFRSTVAQKVSAHTRKKTEGKLLKNGKRSKKTRVVTGTTTISAHDRTIKQNLPRRRFMGQSQYLDKQITRLIAAEIKKAIQ
jgi:phage gpG-like protein